MKKMIALSAVLATSTALAVWAQDTGTTAPSPDTTTGTTGTGTTGTGTTGTGTTGTDTTGTGTTGTGTEGGMTTTPGTGTGMTGTDTGTDTTATGTMGDAGTAGMQIPEGYTMYAGEPMTVEDLQDADVYSMNGEAMSNISDFVVAEDGKIQQVIFDVGGFLGMGARNVAVPFEDLQIYTTADRTDVRAYVPMSREELEALPEYSVQSN